jgi:hypothetical protein
MICGSTYLNASSASGPAKKRASIQWWQLLQCALKLALAQSSVAPSIGATFSHDVLVPIANLRKWYEHGVVLRDTGIIA